MYRKLWIGKMSERSLSLCGPIRLGIVFVITVLTVALLSSAASAANETLLVATNRYVILDDWNTTASLGPGFSLPGATHSADSWTAINTKINATVLFMDSTGSPIIGRIITFNLYMPNGTELAAARVNATTDAYGLANFSFDLNARNYYGNWTVRASNGSINDSTGFIYNWWGCGIGGCNSGHPNSNPSGTQTKNSPYLSGRESPSWSNHNTLVCTYCHQSFDGKPGSNSNTDSANHTMNTQDVHRNITCDNGNCHQLVSVHSTNAVIGSCFNSTGCHTPANRSDISNKSTLNNSNKQIAHSEYSENNGTDFNGTFHTPNSTVPCIICHGPMHNITKPDETQRFKRNNNTEDTHCKACHTNYTEHNSSNITSSGVNCTLCHSDDVHDIQVFAQNATYVDLNHDNPNPSRGNCTNCHQNSTFFTTLKNQSKAGNYTGRNPPQVTSPLEHSNDPNAGNKWNSTPGYWNNSIQLTWCRYCHGNTTHSGAALGRPSLFDGSNVVNSTISLSTSWCAACHWQGYTSGLNNYNNTVDTFKRDNLLAPPEISGNATYAPIGVAGYIDHSGYNKDDSTCKSCHGSLTASTNMTGLMHNVAIGSSGGPDCISCHNAGQSPPSAGGLVNFTAMNDTDAIHKNLNSGASTGLSAENKKCWACHGNGSEPGSGHPPNYKTPYNCTDCHVPGTGQDLNYTPNNTLLTVTQHFWNGTNISTASATSCYSCHNRTEMMVGPNLDPDGAGGVYSGANGGNNSSSHYGKKRSDMTGMDNTTYCNYCHNTSINNATFYVSDFNNTIFNHSSRATTPLCTTCHNTGRIHDNALAKPVSNDSYCSICHGPGGSAVTNNKAKHKTLYCTECHANSSIGTLAGKDIHAVKYLMQNNTFSTTNSSAVDCVTCHQTSKVDSALFGFTAFKIVNPMRHSDNISNGSVWGSYWMNTLPQTACVYCHNNTLHNTTPLGRILQWSSNYQMYGSIGGNVSCSDCHYKGDSNYIQMGSTFTSAGLAIPPEITNGTNWKGVSTNYYNHSLGAYDDQTCSTCHGSLLGGANMSEFMHNAAIGINGGPNCTACHNIGGSAGQNKTVNFTAMNHINASHKNLNSNASTSLPAENKKCWACHGDGSQPAGGHPAEYLNPKQCDYCHVNGAFNSPMVGQHYPGSIFVGAKNHSANFTEGSCQVCHNNSIIFSNIAANINATVGHYATNTSLLQTDTSSSCGVCHNPNSSTTYGVPKKLIDAARHSMNGACQASCHNPYYQNNLSVNPVNLHNTSIAIYYNCYTADCHKVVRSPRG